MFIIFFFFFSSRRRHTRLTCDWSSDVCSSDLDDQGHGFTGIALQGMTGVKLWSKAGWTSATRHDAAYLELPNGAKFVLVTFTTDHANEREIIPTVARVVIDGIGSVK